MNQSGVSTYGAAVSGRVIATLAGVQAVLPARRRRVCVLEPSLRASLSRNRASQSPEAGCHD